MMPGNSQWFTSRFMIEQLKNPITFRSDFPCTGACSATVNFKYQGPIEAGVGYSFKVESQSGAIMQPVSGSISGNTADYTTTANLNTFPDYPTLLPVYDLPVSDIPYMATCTLTYTATCNYIYEQPILISHAPHIVGIQKGNTSDYSGPYTFCEGDFVTLYASQGTAYQWKLNGRNIPTTIGGKSQSLLAFQNGVYTCEITATGGCTGRSNPITINVNANPYPLVEANCTGGGSVTLTAVTAAGATCYWSNQTTGNPKTLSSSNLYYLYIDNLNGCFRKTKINVTTTMRNANNGPSWNSLTATYPSGSCEYVNSGYSTLLASSISNNNSHG